MDGSVYSKAASAIINDIYSGLRGLHGSLSLSVEQLEDEIPLVTMSVIKKHALQGTLDAKSLMRTINCIPIDCMPIDRCPACFNNFICEGDNGLPHFIIPQVVIEPNLESFGYVGSTDMDHPFDVYTSLYSVRYRNSKRRKKNRPYVYIDTTVNKDGFLDGWIFNAPLMSVITVSAIFKDLRDLSMFACCEEIADSPTSIDMEAREMLTALKVKYYRQLAANLNPNTQTPN